MAERARADRAPEDAFAEEASVLPTGWVSRFKLWLAGRIRSRQKITRQRW